MQIELTELNAKVNLATDKNKPEKLLAYATITLKGNSGEYCTISGFSIWISKFEGAPLNVSFPSNTRRFKYFLAEKSFQDRIKKEILNQYEYAITPIVGEEEP